MPRPTWQVFLAPAAAAVLLAAFLGAGASGAQGLALAAVLGVALSGQSPPAVRWVMGALAAAGSAAAAFDAPTDADSVELARALAATAGLCALRAAADAASPARNRTGFWAGAVGAAVAAAGVSLGLAMVAGRPPRPDVTLAAMALFAAGVVVIQPALAGSARASTAAWLGAGVGLSAAAGIVAGSIELPRLGTASTAVPLSGALVMVLSARALHEVAQPRIRRAVIFGVAAVAIAIANLVVSLLIPDWAAVAPAADGLVRDAEWIENWWIPPPVAITVMLMVGLMLLTGASAYARFGWTVGWLCGLLLAVVGIPGLAAWIAGAAVPVPGGVQISAVGSLGMVLLGFNSMQLASRALHSERRSALWLPVLAAVLIAGASMLAAGEAARQETALVEQLTSRVLGQVARGTRDAVEARVEALRRIGAGLDRSDPTQRPTALDRSFGPFASAFPGTLWVAFGDAACSVWLAHHVSGATGLEAPLDPGLRKACNDALSGSRAVLRSLAGGPPPQGPGFMLVVPVSVGGTIHVVVAAGRYAELFDPVLEGLPEEFAVTVFSDQGPVHRLHTVPLRATGQPRVAAIEVLRTSWRVELRGLVGRPGEHGLSRMIVVAGLLFAIMFATTLRLSALARERASAAALVAGAQLAAQRALAASRAEAGRVLDTMAEAVLSIDHEQRITFANARARSLLGAAFASQPDAGIERLLPSGIGSLDGVAFARLCRRATESGELREVGGYAPDLELWLAGRVQPVGAGVTVVLQDVTQARRADAFQREQGEILREIAEGAALDAVLSRICSLYDELHPGATGTVALYDAARSCMWGAVAPGLPSAYGAAIDGLPIGPTAGFGGSAMFRRERVVVADIARDPSSAAWRGFAARLGLAACWSQPLLSRGGEPLGGFTVYWREPREPAVAEIAALETLASICAIAVERERSVRAQADSEQRFRSLFDHQPDGVFACDTDGRVTAINSAVADIFGVPREGLLGLPFDALVDEPGRARARGYFGRALAGEPQRYPTRCRRADGVLREIDMTSLPIVVDGRIVGVYGVVRDVTEQRAAQARLLERDRFFELSPTVFAISDAEGRYTQVNDAFPRLLGLDRDALLSRRITDLLVPDDVAPTLEAWSSLQETGRMRGLVNRHRTADGGVRWLEWNVLRLDERSTYGVAIDVTATMEAREQERRLLRAIGDGPAVLWRFNPFRMPTTEMVTGNVARWGYAPEDFTSGRVRFSDLVHPDERQSVVVGDRERIEAGDDQFAREYRLRTADGRWVWVSEHLQVVRLPGGQVDFCLALSFDVTEERRASGEERRLRQVIELSPAVLWRFNPADAVPTKLVSGNVRDWGYAPEDFTSGRLAFSELIHPDDRARVDDGVRAAVLAGERELQVEFRFRTADGRWLWLDQRVTLLRGVHGELLDCVSLTLDITPQRDALAAVRERDQFYALSLDVFLVTGADARIRQVNDALPRVLGFGHDEVVGRHLLDFVHPDDAVEVQRRIAEALFGKRIELVEVRCRHADGGWRWLEWNASIGASSFFYLAGRDVTAAKAVSAELRRALHDLELRNAELQDFAFVASHDLQEPLRKVQAFSDRVLTRYADRLDPQAVDYLRRMDAAAARMQSLIDDLLAYSRVSTRGGTFRAVDLDLVLDDVLADLEARIESSRGEIVRARLPTVQGDPTQLGQVLQNLIGNALKFAVPGRRPRVEVRADRIADADSGPRRGGWRLIVADNGIGFDNLHADRIFAPFQRLHGRSEYEGTGMGLAIVRKIVERHGGTVNAVGVPGSGATFSVEFPAPQGPQRPVQRVPAETAGHSA